MNSEKSMIKRNGAAIRNLLIAVTLVSLMYFVYMYHDIQSRLRHSDIVSEKFKRDRESLSSQLNEINLEKTNLKEKFYKDRQELAARFAEAQEKHKMLQSQHQDLENEYNRLQQKYEKFSEDKRQKDMNSNQEYMQLKQEKEMEIVKLKDENANIVREYKQLKLELIELKKQVEQQQQEAFQAWNYASQLKKTVDHLQLSLNRETRTSDMLRKYLSIAKAINMVFLKLRFFSNSFPTPSFFYPFLTSYSSSSSTSSLLLTLTTVHRIMILFSCSCQYLSLEYLGTAS
ncbi:Golgi integral membrane protein 4 isoform X2 [Octopus bimaculoides]|uniref:Golgi integral membrane protein 4 isoform X2 n=1 Tax=Octopus bimaculoides TaxID=37653 RepID=UPI0022E3C2B5|nr:Golgi integral membrane protein 4 isoform X2 [Octopus bimaculoides]